MKIKIYGCRGSAAVSRNSRYGGNTSCMSLESNGELLILDAGSGLLALEDELAINPDCNINILLSHLHFDHIIGLSAFSPIWNPAINTRVFSCSHDERPLDEQIFGTFCPPYWPVAIKDRIFAQCIPIEAGVPFKVGTFTITPFEAEHPDKTLSYHITDGHKRVVHMLDSEITHTDGSEYEHLMEHCRDADLVVFDATYSDEDYQTRKGWGHSTVKDGVYFAEKWNCRRILFSHFCRKYSDDKLDSLKKHFDAADSRFILAYDGLEMVL